MDLLKIIGLSGNLFYSQIQYDDGELHFHLGPETTNGYLSDTHQIDDYLEKKCQRLHIQADIGVSENAHTIYGTSKQECMDHIESLIKAIKKDGFKIVVKHTK